MILVLKFVSGCPKEDCKQVNEKMHQVRWMEYEKKRKTVRESERVREREREKERGREGGRERETERTNEFYP